MLECDAPDPIKLDKYRLKSNQLFYFKEKANKTASIRVSLPCLSTSLSSCIKCLFPFFGIVLSKFRSSIVFRCIIVIIEHRITCHKEAVFMEFRIEAREFVSLAFLKRMQFRSLITKKES